MSSENFFIFVVGARKENTDICKGIRTVIFELSCELTFAMVTHHPSWSFPTDFPLTLSSRDTLVAPNPLWLMFMKPLLMFDSYERGVICVHYISANTALCIHIS